MNLKDQVRYLLHGILFSLFFINLWTIWGLIILALTPALRYLADLGFYVETLILLLILGGLNTLLAGGLDAILPARLQSLVPSSLKRILNWRLWFSVKRSIFRVLAQGLLLLILMFVIDFLFRTLLLDFYPGLSTAIASFLITSYLNGYLGKGTAGVFRGIED